MGYNVLPQPWTGQLDPYGLVPGFLDAVTPASASYHPIAPVSTVGMPNPFADLSAVYPELGRHTNAASAIVGSQLSGQLSPDELAAIQDASARYGITSGMAGGGLQRNRTVRDIGLTTGQRQQQGLTNQQALARSIADTQTVSPALQAQIGGMNANAQNQYNLATSQGQNQMDQFNTNNANQFTLQNVGIARENAALAATPNPRSVQTEAQRIFNEYQQKFAGGGTGAVGGGSRVVSPAGGSGSYGVGSGGGGASSWINPAAGMWSVNGTGETPAAMLQRTSVANNGNNAWTGGPASVLPQSTYTPQDLSSMIAPSTWASGTRDFSNFGSGGGAQVQNLANLFTGPDFNLLSNLGNTDNDWQGEWWQ